MINDLETIPKKDAAVGLAALVVGTHVHNIDRMALGALLEVLAIKVPTLEKTHRRETTDLVMCMKRARSVRCGQQDEALLALTWFSSSHMPCIQAGVEVEAGAGVGREGFCVACRGALHPLGGMGSPSWR